MKISVGSFEQTNHDFAHMAQQPYFVGLELFTNSSFFGILIIVCKVRY